MIWLAVDETIDLLFDLLEAFYESPGVTVGDKSARPQSDLHRTLDGIGFLHYHTSPG